MDGGLIVLGRFHFQFFFIKKDQEMALFLVSYFRLCISFVEIFRRRNGIFHFGRRVFYNTSLTECEVDLWTRFGKGQQSGF